MTRLLLTGATGFVGGALLERILSGTTLEVTAATRESLAPRQRVTPFRIEGLDCSTEWKDALVDTQVVLHAAARVHVMIERAGDPLAEFRKVNVEGTMNLARQAAAAGVRRFLFVSSIKVNGEGTEPGKPYRADDVPLPSGPYGISKLEAEQALLALGAATGMEVVIVRPVIVYGPGVRANFLQMMRWLERGIPLPLGAIRNCRSLVSLDNLVDLMVRCIDHPAAANQVFLVSDGEDLSTPDLLRRMGAAMGTPARLLPVPEWLLTAAAASIGRRSISRRLCGSLQVDIEKTRELLGWAPPVSVDEALRKTARSYLEYRRANRSRD